MAQKQSFRMIAELKEFAIFTGAEQRYIRRSLDIAAKGSEDADCWVRNQAEQASIDSQVRIYRTLLPAVRGSIPNDIALDAGMEFLAHLATLTAFDLGEGKLESFGAYRFLYERLLGGAVRPWLPSAFLAAAALPYLNPALRKILLRSINESDVLAGGWSSLAPVFRPEWVDKVPVTVS